MFTYMLIEIYIDIYEHIKLCKNYYVFLCGVICCYTIYLYMCIITSKVSSEKE